ncbi:MAG: hypothetical protein D6679_05680 [Candidatus Hydrogenedentota bacterium]|nr:MAG: hypothetical protein D6679_05680 [Candidatus Hydrogenedentota bacterium]
MSRETNLMKETSEPSPQEPPKGARETLLDLGAVALILLAVVIAAIRLSGRKSDLPAEEPDLSPATVSLRVRLDEAWAEPDLREKALPGEEVVSLNGNVHARIRYRNGRTAQLIASGPKAFLYGASLLPGAYTRWKGDDFVLSGFILARAETVPSPPPR